MKKKQKQTDLSRRSFIKNAGLAGVAAGAVAILGNVQNNAAQAAANVRYVTPYEAMMQGGGRIYGRSAKSPGPAGPIGFEDRDISNNEIVSTVDCDVVVVGAGMTGMIASLKAASMGKKVIVLEKMNVGRGIFECYGSVNSTVLKEAHQNPAFTGVTTDLTLSEKEKVALIRDFYDTADWRLRRGAVHTFVNRSGEAADFMESMFKKGTGGINSVPAVNTDPNGIKYECKFNVPAFMASGTTSADVGLQGLYVVRELAMVGKTQYPSLFSVRYNTPAVQLIREGDGPVTGVIAKDGTGYLQFNARKGVIIASGGYDSNPEMLEAYCRSEDYANLTWWNGHFGPTGDGHMMGLRAGAIMDSTPHAVMSFCLMPTGTSKFVKYSTNMAMMTGTSFQVNGEGKRFMDESLGLLKTSYMVHASGAQEGFGDNIWYIGTGYLDRSGGPSIDLLKAKGDFHEASSISELARLCGIDHDGLEKTVQDWNSACNNGLGTAPNTGLDMEFGRQLTASNVFSASTYYAMRSRIGFVLATVSGLQIDGNCRVLGTDDKPIEGLYAGGNASGSFYAEHYPRHIAGSSIGRAITFGYVSAEHACNR